jgi:hypothetical protein
MTERTEHSTWVPIDEETAMSIIGEGIHTGVRKGSEDPSSAKLWGMIADSGTSWDDALHWLMYGLDAMDMALCKREKVQDERLEEADR